jgi:hypothetical protein
MSEGKRTYRACSTKRSRRTKADISAIRTAIRDVIEDDPPMTVRQVFYQLVARGAIEKTELAYQGTVIRLMTEMRLDGSLSYSWVVDESRRVRITETYDSIQDALEQTANSIAAARSRRLPTTSKSGARRMRSPESYGT